MLKYILVVLLLIHAVAHLPGFVKALYPASVTQLTRSVSLPAGIMWLFAALIFIASAVLLLTGRAGWYYTIAAGIIISQVLIIFFWHDAKYGTILNIIFLGAAVLAFGMHRFENGFMTDVNKENERASRVKEEILTENDLLHLPAVVQKYIRMSVATGKPKLKSMKVVFTGQMREKGKDYFDFESVQYNFFDQPSRLFFMKAQMFGLTVPGYHRFMNNNASMDIRLFGMIPVVYQSGNKMNRTETVTLFNDMCLLAPASLISKNITWEETDSLSVKAFFTLGENTISAVLYFNDKGELINFRSEDRTDVNKNRLYPFSTPVHGYMEYAGRKVISSGDAVWHYEDGEFTYGKFNLKEIVYNPASVH